MLTKKLQPVQSFLSLVSRSVGHFPRQHYDVIVVGGGHAGTEAAAAAARLGAETLLITQKIHTIGALSCNPSLGGVGKGHLVREVDALDGLCGRAGDWAGISFSILNRRKGPAVWGPRAQLDRQRYREFMQSELLSTPRLTVMEGSVEELLVTDPNPEQPGQHRVNGICLANSSHPISASSVVLTTGTFLSGSLFIGQTTSPGGRIGDAPSSAGLSHTLRERLGLKVGRLRTGTPPRIVKDSVDLSLATLNPPDSSPTPFSFMNTHTRCRPEEQLPCYLTYTTPGVERVVRESLHLNCHIQQDAKGPRYCPSIESRVLRFPGRRHQVWLEPEGLTSDLLYPQGLSMTMPPDVQLRLIREIPPLHKAEIHMPVLRLWVCVCVCRRALSKPPVALSRTESYIGVLIDDLVSRGVTEPYRMFTSRAEFRTSLRPDNADLRLTLKGFELGCVSSSRHQKAVRVKNSLQDALAALQALSLSTTSWKRKIPDVHVSEANSNMLSGIEMLQYKDVSFQVLASIFPEVLLPFMEFSQRLKIEAVYRPHCESNKREIQRIQEEENMSLPEDIDYLSLPVSLSQEVREVLHRARPSTLGAATRLEGITPAAVVNLFNYVCFAEKRKKTSHGNQRRQKEGREEELCASLPQ
uniref:Mitochondrial translation optimization 1 homolog n=1 Tax=Nothobranchius kadleci TaxID=1051664 RepID=A0A1A8CN80_NOTKA